MLQTKKNEVVSVTSDPKRMFNKFLVKRLLRTWTDYFTDMDTGEKTPIERSELIADRGRLIDNDLLARIKFYIDAGDIKEVTVSNQRREAYPVENTQLYPWLVTVNLRDKKKKFLLYAASVSMALEVATDYIELNYQHGFYFVGVKEVDSVVILKDNLGEYQVDGEETTDTAPEDQQKKFYQIEVNIEAGYPITKTFIIETTDADRALMIINNYIADKLKQEAEKNNDEPEEFVCKLETAKIFSCNHFIDKEFSLAYAE